MMTFYTIFALILLPILGGFIAWAGDVIGYRLGKSRRSLLGMRPRVTARVVGIVVGVLLVLATLAVAAAGSREVSDALFNLAQLRSAQTTLGHQNDVLQEQVQTARQQADKAQTQVTELYEQSEELNTQVEETQEMLRRANSQLSSVRSQLSTARRDRDKVAAERDDLTAQRDKLKDQLTQLTDKYVKTNANLAEAEVNLQDAQQQNDKLRAKNEELHAEQTKLKQENLQLVSTNDTLRHRQEDLNRKIEKLNNSITEFDTRAADSRARMEDAEAEARALLNDLFAWQMGAAGRPLMYEPGEEIICAVLDTDQTGAQMEASIWELLHIASGIAAGRGAVIGENGMAVKVLAPIPPERLGEEVPEAEIVRDLARRIRRSPTHGFVVSVRSLRRVFEGEGGQVQVELWGTPNSRLFREGDVILSASLDGSAPRGEVFRDLLTLMTQIRRVLRERDLMPDPETGQFFTVPAEDILMVMDDLLEAGGKRKLEAVAGVDIYKLMPEHEAVSVRLRVVPRDT